MGERLEKAKKMPCIVKQVADDVRSLLGNATAFTIVPAQNQQFEVQGADSAIVDEMTKSCSCGKWQEDKVPCVHAVAVAVFMRKPLEELIGEEYHQSTLLKCYGTLLPAIRARNSWMATEDEVQEQVALPVEKRGR
ncbi:hypothetical protein GEMRC1_009621 [Eukaryota sp. GEM-RC1]